MSNNKNPDKGKDHHVAWADRVGLNKQWARDILSCGEVFNTEYYCSTVRRFRNNIPNIKNGPQLKTMIDTYVNNDLSKLKDDEYDKWVSRNPQLAGNDAYKRSKWKDIKTWGCERLYQYMLQMLENYGFCFYESSTEEDEKKME